MTYFLLDLATIQFKTAFLLSRMILFFRYSSQIVATKFNR